MLLNIVSPITCLRHHCLLINFLMVMCIKHLIELTQKGGSLCYPIVLRLARGQLDSHNKVIGVT